MVYIIIDYLYKNKVELTLLLLKNNIIVEFVLSDTKKNKITIAHCVIKTNLEYVVYVLSIARS